MPRGRACSAQLCAPAAGVAATRAENPLAAPCTLPDALLRCRAPSVYGTCWATDATRGSCRAGADRYMGVVCAGSCAQGNGCVCSGVAPHTLAGASGNPTVPAKPASDTCGTADRCAGAAAAAAVDCGVATPANPWRAETMCEPCVPVGSAGHWGWPVADAPPVGSTNASIRLTSPLPPRGALLWLIASRKEGKVQERAAVPLVCVLQPDQSASVLQGGFAPSRECSGASQLRHALLVACRWATPQLRWPS